MTLDPTIVNEDLRRTNVELRAELERERSLRFGGLLFTLDEITRAFERIETRTFGDAYRAGLTAEDSERITKIDVFKTFKQGLLRERAERAAGGRARKVSK